MELKSSTRNQEGWISRLAEAGCKSVSQKVVIFVG
jgi:hypothetical protein